MTSEQLATEVATLETQIAAALTDLDNLVVAGQHEISVEAQAWIQRSVERHVTDHPELVQRAGVDKLRTLKARVSELIRELPTLVESSMSDKNRWPHRIKDLGNPTTAQMIGPVHVTSEGYLEGSFRAAISQLGPLLDEFGLLPASTPGYPEWKRTGPGKVEYAINPGFDFRKHGALSRYVSERAKLQVVEEQLKKIREQLEKAKARELWDSA